MRAASPALLALLSAAGPRPGFGAAATAGVSFAAEAVLSRLVEVTKHKAAEKVALAGLDGGQNAAAGFWGALRDRLLGSNPVTGEAVYDLVIDVDSFSRIGTRQGWPIYHGERHREETIARLLAPLQSTLVVGVVGAYNRGKTHVVNKLAKSSYQAGLLQHTHGISAALPRHSSANKWVLLDTAGSDQPLQGSRDADILDKRYSEQFLQDAVITLSDVIVVVVNSLRFSDQKFLADLHLKISRYQNSAYKRVIVVHNYREFSEVEDVTTKMRQDLITHLSCVEEVTEVGKRRYAWWRDARSWSHVVLAQDGSPAGDVYNELSVELLEMWLGAAYKDKALTGAHEASALGAAERPPSLVGRFLQITAAWLPGFFQLPPGGGRLTVEDNPPRIVLESALWAPLQYRSHLASLPGRMIGNEPSAFTPQYDLLTNASHSLLFVDLPGVLERPRKRVAQRPDRFSTTIGFEESGELEEEEAWEGSAWSATAPGIPTANRGAATARAEGPRVQVVVHHIPKKGFQQARVQVLARRRKPREYLAGGLRPHREAQRLFGASALPPVLLPDDVRVASADAELSAGVLRVALAHAGAEDEDDLAPDQPLDLPQDEAAASAALPAPGRAEL